MSEHTKGAYETVIQLRADRDSLKAKFEAASAQNEKLLAMVQEQDRMLGHKACATKECRELLAARALLREVLDDGYFMVRCIELGDVNGLNWELRVKRYLDTCDTLGGNSEVGS